MVTVVHEHFFRNINAFRYLSGLSHKTVWLLIAVHLYLWHHTLALCMRLDNYLHGWFCAIWSLSTYSRFLPLTCVCLSPSAYQFTNVYVMHLKYFYSPPFLRFCEWSLVHLIKRLTLMLRYELSTTRTLYISCLSSTSLKPLFWLYLATLWQKRPQMMPYPWHHSWSLYMVIHGSYCSCMTIDYAN